jgi:hypothetical protein
MHLPKIDQQLSSNEYKGLNLNSAAVLREAEMEKGLPYQSDINPTVRFCSEECKDAAHKELTIPTTNFDELEPFWDDGEPEDLRSRSRLVRLLERACRRFQKDPGLFALMTDECVPLINILPTSWKLTSAK